MQKLKLRLFRKADGKVYHITVSKQCRRIAASLVYFLFIAVLVFNWWGKFRGVTKTEIDWANGRTPVNVGFDRSLLIEPTEEDDYFGMKTSEDNPEDIMTGVWNRVTASNEDIIQEIGKHSEYNRARRCYHAERNTDGLL